MPWGSYHSQRCISPPTRLLLRLFALMRHPRCVRTLPPAKTAWLEWVASSTPPARSERPPPASTWPAEHDPAEGFADIHFADAEACGLDAGGAEARDLFI